MDRIVVIATGNSHKIEEFNRLARVANTVIPKPIASASPLSRGSDVRTGSASANASGARVRFVCAKEVIAEGMPHVDENANSFVGNAQLKAYALKEIVPKDFWVLADDSGLCVDALDGAPGVETARYAGERSTAAENRAKLLKALEGVPKGKRGAHFACVLFLISPDGNEHVFSATCEGEISERESDGGFGFGYDPIFIPRGFEQTFAELPGEMKDALSHRGRAFAKLANFLAEARQ